MAAISRACAPLALAYFGKEPKRLTTAEAALLVALPQSPEARRPDRDTQAARAARDRVLDRLVAEGVTDADAAMAAPGERVPAGAPALPDAGAASGAAGGRRRSRPSRCIA